jgi:NDP-4-keto-2,6-dideoxyhexose 3-C-methyltransferase
MTTQISKCRICSNTELVPVVDLGIQYLTGVFPKTKDEPLTSGPLKLVKCHGDACCGLLQLESSYDSSEMYGDNYGYRSGLNPSMVNHLRGKVDRIVRKVDLQPGAVVIDIGSNDGTTLSAYPKNLRLVGIDPTGSKFAEHYPAHVELLPEFFSAAAVKRAVPNKKAKVVTSFAMFYDLEDPVDFAAQIAEVLDPVDGIWVFEQSYMPLMLERNAYDTICHEHVEYYGLEQIVWLTQKAGLKVVDVEINDVNGGSFSVVAAHRGSRHDDSANSVARMLASESAAGLSTLAPYEAFQHRARQSRDRIREFVASANRKGERVNGLGASTKGNVVLQYCGFTSADISAIGDVNPDKFDAFTPGTWIPIRDEKEVLSSNPEYLLVLPWHFRNFFVGSRLFKGRRLVFPLPDLEVVSVQ